MTEVMKVLAIFSAIFMPLTFVAGIYGMNFDLMPELRWTWGYPGVMILMAGIALGLASYFKYRKWM
jgi:magnesium transporter